VVSADELKDDEEYEDIMEDMRLEAGKYGTACLVMFTNTPSAPYVDCFSNTNSNKKSTLLSGALVKVVIPRPDPRGLPVGGVGKVRLV
jgi:splicing factor U2AF 65 kDa subunit